MKGQLDRDVRDLARACGLNVNAKKAPVGKATWYDFYVGPDKGPGCWREGGKSWIGKQSFIGAREALTFLQGYYAGRNA